MLTRISYFFMLPAATALPALAQTGQITGRVTDEHGAVVEGVAVTITTASTGQQTKFRTNTDGYYTVPSLLPGHYSVGFEKEGFRSVSRTGLELQVDQDLRVDVSLQVGEVAQQVVVTGQEPQLETDTSSAGQVVSGSNIVQLPLLGRDAYALGELAPGVRGSIGMNSLPVDIITTSSISINGAPATENDFSARRRAKQHRLRQSAGHIPHCRFRAGVQGADQQLQCRVWARGRRHLQRGHERRFKRSALQRL